MIILDSVCKSYHHGKSNQFMAVHPLSLSIDQGEVFGLMGYSGAGKSTLLRLINLLERPDSGKVLVDGQDLTAMSPAQLRTALLHQGHLLEVADVRDKQILAHTDIGRELVQED